MTRQNPVLTRTLLALLTSATVYGVLGRNHTTVSAQEDWATVNSTTLGNGTVPDPTAAKEEITAQESPELTTFITTTLNTIDGDLMKVELDNPTTDSSFEVEGLITGTITLDVAGMRKVAAACNKCYTIHIGKL